MRYLDITHEITDGMKKYPTDPEVSVSLFKSLKNGNSCNLYKLSLGSHAGTHIEAPHHMFRDGRAIDDIKIEQLICNVFLIGAENILSGGLSKKIREKGVQGILLKRGKRKAYLDMETAEKLLKDKIRLVGTDEMSIEDPSDKAHPVHHLLMKKGVVILENLKLESAKKGFYKFIALPLKIKGADASPARAVLIW